MSDVGESLVTRRHKKALLSAGLSAAGVASLVLWPPLGVGFGFAAFRVGFAGLYALNDRWGRTAVIAGGLTQAAAIAVGSGSWPLAASVLPMPVLTPPSELSVRRMGYRANLSVALALPLSVALILVSWPPSLWWLAPVPVLAFNAKLVPSVLRTLRNMALNNKARWTLDVGDSVPDFRLPARRGQPEFSMSAERGRHVMIHFTRGDWCPVCHVMLRILKREAPRLAELDVKLVVIGPQQGSEADDFTRDLGLEYTFLCDPEHKIAAQFGALDPRAYNGNGGPLPASFLVGPDGVLTYASPSGEAGSFPDPRDFLKAIESSPESR